MFGKAFDDLGPHLLGRKEQPYDERDYKLEDYLESHKRLNQAFTPTMTLEELATSGDLLSWPDIYVFWRWFKRHILNPLKPTPVPPTPPEPTPPGGAVEWSDTESVLDQGQTPHCVGFSGADWMNTLPVDDRVGNAMGHELYYACKVVDGEPKAEDGSFTRSLLKVLKARGRIGAYAMTTSADTVVAYVRDHGSVFIGIPWMNDMFYPDGDNYLSPTGGEAGGHEVTVIGESPTGYPGRSEPSVEILNHWGADWGKNGRAYMTVKTLQSLLDQGGDAGAALENPLA